MNEVAHSQEKPSQVAPERAFADALVSVKSGKQAQAAFEGALLLVAEERPEMRYDVYRRLSYQSKKIVGPTLTIEEAARHIEERRGLKQFTEAFFKWIEDKTSGQMLNITFRPRDLDEAGCVRLGRDALLSELRALGVVVNASGLYQSRLTERGVELHEYLKKQASL